MDNSARVIDFLDPSKGIPLHTNLTHDVPSACHRTHLTIAFQSQSTYLLTVHPTHALVSPAKIVDINTRLAALGVSENDLREEFIRGSGKGGQKINKTSSCVQLTYLKTGFVVKCQESRSRELNRFLAKRILVERLENERDGVEGKKEKLRHKIRAQKKKRSKRAKEKMLDNKKHRGETKRLRKKSFDEI